MDHPVTNAELDTFYGVEQNQHPLSLGVQEVINAIRKVNQYHEWDVSQVLMALCCKLREDTNSHIHADYTDELDQLALYIEDEIL